MNRVINAVQFSENFLLFNQNMSTTGKVELRPWLGGSKFPTEVVFCGQKTINFFQCIN